MHRIMDEGFSKKIEIPKEMKFKIEQLYNIRNAFAHSLFSWQILQKLKVINCGSFNNLEEVDKKHKKLYEEITGFISDNSVQKID